MAVFANSFLREEWLMKRFSGIIQKSQQTLDMNKTAATSSTVDLGRSSACKKNAYDRMMRKRNDMRSAAVVAAPADHKMMMRMRRNEMELKRKDARRKFEIQKKREAARREIDQMLDPCAICEDPQQVMRDFEKLIGIGNNAGNQQQQHVSLTPYGSNSLLILYAKLMTENGSSAAGSGCYEEYKKSLSCSNTTKSSTTTDNCRGRVHKVVVEVEEGEIVE